MSSETPNSVQTKNYKYTDTESGKFGTRYYRLHQVDLDGKDSYSPVRAVNFDGAATGAVALSVYPNPFLDTDKVSLNFGTDVPNGVAQVQLIDMVGRTVRQQSLAINNSSLDLGNLSATCAAASTWPASRWRMAGTQSIRLQKK
ncbi:MAG: T9SS type A sorting domain-containing protein [Hymenobacter sp.]